MIHYRKLGTGNQTIVIVHGLFGNADNWQTIGKWLADDYQVLLPDMRNHGHSFHADEFSYEIMAEDLAEVVAHENLTELMLAGHSMGGKASMVFADKYPWLVKKLVVLDIGVKEYPMHHQVILEALGSADLDTLGSRKAVEAYLAGFIHDAGTLQFLMKNLYWKERDQLGWRINIPVLDASMPEILRGIKVKNKEVDTLFVRGAKSNYIPDEDVADLLATYKLSELVTVDAGHWIHAEKPQEVLEILRAAAESAF